MRHSLSRPIAFVSPLLALALCGAAPAPNPSVLPDKIPSLTATVGVPYTPSYSCVLRGRKTAKAVCYSLGLPAGLQVASAPGCEPRTPTLLSFKGSAPTITCTISGTPMAAGAFNISVHGGAGGMRPRTASRPFSVAKGAPATALAALPNPVAAGSRVVFTATVTSASGPPPTGVIGLRNATTNTTLETLPLSNGTVLFSVTPAAPGTTAYVAVYSGDANYIGQFSQPFLNLTVN